MSGSNRPSTEREPTAPLKELEQYRRRLDGAMLAGDLAWWEMDVETGSVGFHEHKPALLGLSPEAFDHYEDFTERIHDGDYDRVMAAMSDHIEGHAEKYDVEYRIQTADGEYIWFHDVGGVTERDEDGTPLKVTGIVIDVTERREMQEKLRHKNEQLSLLNRILRHDISNDMSIIAGWADLLADELPPEQQEKLSRIRRASAHTAELTSNARELMAVLDDDATMLTLEPVELEPVVRNEVDRVTQTFESVEIRPPEAFPAVHVEANGMLSSVIGNLLNNAVQHADTDEILIDIDIDLRDETVVIAIADNGPGIPEDQRDAVFERDVQGLDSDGTGLGLYLVETLVDAYGGSAHVEANDPTGTVFVVELPQVSR